MTTQVGRDSPENWTPDEIHALMEMRGRGLSWRDLAGQIPGRAEKPCRRRYARLLADEAIRSKLAESYNCHREKVWSEIAAQMPGSVAWVEAEQNHWRIGKAEVPKRARDEFIADLQQQQQQGSKSKRPQRYWSGREEALLSRIEGLQWSGTIFRDVCLEAGRTPDDAMDGGQSARTSYA
ncbi:hypothetical protein E4U09_006146, partial [Claviceps aff. purpurea]